MLSTKRNPFFAAIAIITCCFPAGDRASVAQLIQAANEKAQPRELSRASVIPPEVVEASPRAETCAACPPGPGWVGECFGGDDNLMTSARVGIDLPPLDCLAPPDTILTLTGPMVVQRADPVGASISTQILAMSLTDGTVTLSAGAGGGMMGMLRSSLGEIAQQDGDITQADSFFDVYFEVDLGGPGPFLFNSEQDPLRVAAVIDCVPPEAVFVNLASDSCKPLYETPTVIGPPVANLVFVEHQVPPPPPPPPDYHASPPDLSWVVFEQVGGIPPLPADFFGPGSDPFEGQVNFEGDPIDPATLGGTSTILQRNGDPVAPADPAGTAGTVQIELVALSLRSTQPIIVTYGGTQPPEEWDVHVGLSPTPAPVGWLSATKTHANGGSYDVTIYVQPLLIFRRVSDGTVQTLDTAAEGQGPYELAGSGHFVHTVDSFFDVFYDVNAQWVGGIEETEPGNTASQIAELIFVEPLDGLRRIVHGVVPPPPPPCPLPGSPSIDPCAALQMRDCMTGLQTDFCLPRVAQVDPTGIGFEALACDCFPEGPDCGPITISPDRQTISCPGICVPPDVPGPCLIFADYGNGPVSTGMQSAPAGMFPPGTPLTCDCPAEEPCPLPEPPAMDPCGTLQMQDCIPGLSTDLCLPRIAQVSFTGSGFEAIQCDCFPEGPDCGPITISPDRQTISCPGTCVPPDVPGPCLIFADFGGGPVSTGLQTAPVGMFQPGVLLTCDCETPEPCPLPQSPQVDPCAALQTRDCLPGPLTDLCLPRVAQVGPAGFGFEALACDCFPEGPDCGPITISPDQQTISCPGTCVPPDLPGPCLIFADFGGGPVSTGLQTAPVGMFQPGVLLTCDCETPEPCPLPQTPDIDPCAALQLRDCLPGLPSELCLPRVAQVSSAGPAFEALECSCFPESEECGPIMITPDHQIVFCPGVCVPPDVPGPCVIFIQDPGGGPPTSTHMPSAQAGAFPPGTLLTCDCETPVGDPLPATGQQSRRKNRYISWDPNKAENDGNNVAFKVELKSIRQGSCNDTTGGKEDFCRIDRGEADCRICLGCASPPCKTCITTPIHCSTGGGVCTATGALCVNDLPHTGGSNVGQAWWVGPEHPSLNGVHLLVSQTFRKISTDWPNPTHAGDCEVVPRASYGVRAVETIGGAESGELPVETTQFPAVAPPAPFWWADAIGALAYFCNGDITQAGCTSPLDCGGDPCLRAWTLPNGTVNFDDVNAALTLVAPPGVGVPAQRTWVDLHPVGGDAGPNSIMNSSDLQQFIFGFGGFPYTGYDPKDCDPAVVAWP